MAQDTATAPPRHAPLDLSRHFSKTTRNRKESSIKDFYKYFAIPGIANLAGGLPNASYFPYDTLEASVALPGRFKPTPNHPTTLHDRDDAARRPPSAEVASNETPPPSSRLLVPKDAHTDNVLHRIDITSALQYGTAQGYPSLATFLRRFTRDHLHPSVPYAPGPDIILTAGNTDGFSKSLELLTNAWSEETDWIRERQGMLVEEFAYMNSIQAAEPRGLNIVPVGMDHEGMRSEGPGGLRDVLSNWDDRKGKRPHLMYTVTIGQNPTGTTLGVKRRQELYRLCQEYDIIIIEDDPYWYLQYPSAAESEKARGGIPPDETPPITAAQASSGYDFLDSLVPSYLAFDEDGRVIRLDTFSKTVSPGCRLGWITAQPAFVERLLRITETSTQQPSGFVQSMVAELIVGPHDPDDPGRGGAEDGKGWSMDGWVRWLEGLRGAYERRMQAMCRILDEGRFLVRSEPGTTEAARDLDGDDDDDDEDAAATAAADQWNVLEKVPMYDFHYPRGGMFVWLELNLASHPLYAVMPLAQLSHALWVHLTTKHYLVLVAPGTIFSPTAEIAEAKGPSYFRLCFAAVPEDEVEAASQRVVAAFQQFWSKKDVKELEGDMCAAVSDQKWLFVAATGKGSALTL